VWVGGREGGYILSPATSLTKICMVGSASAEEAREERGEMLEMLVMLLERAMLAAMGGGLVRCLSWAVWTGRVIWMCLGVP